MSCCYKLLFSLGFFFFFFFPREQKSRILWTEGRFGVVVVVRFGHFVSKTFVFVLPQWGTADAEINTRFNDLDLDVRSQCVGKGKHRPRMLSATKRAISIKLATTVGHFVRDLDLDIENSTSAREDAIHSHSDKCSINSHRFLV